MFLVQIKFGRRRRTFVFNPDKKGKFLSECMSESPDKMPNLPKVCLKVRIRIGARGCLLFPPRSSTSSTSLASFSPRSRRHLQLKQFTLLSPAAFLIINNLNRYSTKRKIFFRDCSSRFFLLQKNLQNLLLCRFKNCSLVKRR